MKNIPFFGGHFIKKKNICTHTRAHIYIHVYYPLSIFCDLYAYVSELNMYKYIYTYI